MTAPAIMPRRTPTTAREAEVTRLSARVAALEGLLALMPDMLTEAADYMDTEGGGCSCGPGREVCAEHRLRRAASVITEALTPIPPEAAPDHE